MDSNQDHYTVRTWGRVYRSNGVTVGIMGTVRGLTYQDVCDQITHASRRGDYIDVLDEQGRLVSIGQFQTD